MSTSRDGLCVHVVLVNICQSIDGLEGCSQGRGDLVQLARNAAVNVLVADRHNEAANDGGVDLYTEKKVSACVTSCSDKHALVLILSVWPFLMKLDSESLTEASVGVSSVCMTSSA